MFLRFICRFFECCSDDKSSRKYWNRFLIPVIFARVTLPLFILYNMRKQDGQKSFSPAWKSVGAFVRREVANLEEQGRWGCARKYMETWRSFSAFLEGGELRFVEWDGELIGRYAAWLSARGVCRNTLSFYMRCLRALYNKAAEVGIPLAANPFRRVYTGIDKTRKRAVDGQWLMRLREADLQRQPALRRTRDVFLFSFYARGMAFVDIAYLRKENISRRMLFYVRRKTGQQLWIRLEPCMQEILERYNDPASPYLFPFLRAEDSVQAYRQYLAALNNYNKCLRRLSASLALSPSLSSYVARHSWATQAHRLQVPISVISEGMGHTSEKTTRIYLSSLHHAVIDDANQTVIASIF